MSDIISLLIIGGELAFLACARWRVGGTVTDSSIKVDVYKR